jgi:hypothetical protein
VSDQLKPCPFCCKPAKRYFTNVVGCTDTVNCGAQIELGDHGTRTIEYTIESWNRRVENEALQWRCVSDVLPEKEGVYLCHFSDGVTETFPYEGEDYPGMWGVSGTIVTHWMPLPEQPELRVEEEK